MSIGALQGVGRLAADGVIGVSRIAEQLHAAITFSPRPQTRGITGFVYRSVRGIAAGAGDGVDLALRAAASLLTQGDEPAALATPRAILNGLLGDHLHRAGNPLALPMRLYDAQRRVAPSPQALAAGQPADARRLLVLVHGLFLGPHSWQREEHDHGQALALALGYTPIYVEYNTGRRIAENGVDFARTMQQLVEAWPVPVERLAILAHSMGGLVSRSACRVAEDEGHDWLQRLDDLVFLGTPHHGAALARVAPQVEGLLRRNAYSAPFALLARMRSAGIDDLCHADLGGGDTVGANPEAASATTLPLPARVRCRAIAGSLGTRRQGDGLVTVDSAFGDHPEPARSLGIAKSDRLLVPQAGHFALLDDARVQHQLQRWLAPADRARPRRRKA